MFKKSRRSEMRAWIVFLPKVCFPRLIAKTSLFELERMQSYTILYANNICNLIACAQLIKIQNFVHENASENIVCEMAAILSKGDESTVCRDVALLHGRHGRDSYEIEGISKINVSVHLGYAFTMIFWKYTLRFSRLSLINMYNIVSPRHLYIAHLISQGLTTWNSVS